MKKTISLVLILLGSIAIFFTSCAPPAAQTQAINMDSLRVTIQAMEDAYAAAEKAKDADAVVAYYSDDAVSYSRDKAPASGKQAIRDRIAERMATDTSGVVNVYKVVDLYAEGNMAVEIGSWTDIDSAGTEVGNGFYMSYFEKRDGKYVCVRDMNVKLSADQTPKP